MDNPETLATLDTQDTGRGQTKHKNTTQKTKKMRNTDHTKNTTQKTKKMSNTDPPKMGVNPGARKGYGMPLVRHPQYYSYSQDMFDTTIHKHTTNNLN